MTTPSMSSENSDPAPGIPAGAILTLNAGSSSVKFAIYEPRPEPMEMLRGQVSHLGVSARLEVEISGGLDDKTAQMAAHTQAVQREIGSANHHQALEVIVDVAREHLSGRPVLGVGHRIAHGGMQFTGPQRLDAETVAQLEALSPFAPLHQPHNLAALAAARALFPDALQLGCFDTAFHRGHPWVNDTFALPRYLYDKGLRRYGFHGLSYDYITDRLHTVAPDVAHQRVVIAHLGNGASMCAVKDGRSIASTMGFSALDGLPMGTRCGQLDPGALLYLLEHEGMTTDEVTSMLYRESGLKGLSGWTNDMQALLASDAPAARDAIDYFVFRIRRELGAMCAVLGGIDALVFTGGIGENAAPIRAAVCDGMDWIGVGVDADKNSANVCDISAASTRVLVVPTDEERIIARALAAELSPT